MKIILLVLLLFSCSSSKKVDKNSQEQSFEYDWISNSDFNSISQNKVNLDNDYYRDLNLKDKIFSKETFAREVKNLSKSNKQFNDLLTKATYLCYKKDFVASDVILKKMYKANKKNARYFNVKGICRIQRNQLDLAFISFNKAIALDKSYSPAYNNIGVIYSKRNLKYLSLKFFKKAYSRNLFSKTPKYNLANLYLSFGLYLKAEPLLLDLISLDSNDQEINYSLAVSYLYKKNIKRSFYFLSKLKNVGVPVLNSILQKSKENKKKAWLEFSEKFSSHYPMFSKNLSLIWRQ